MLPYGNIMLCSILERFDDVVCRPNTSWHPLCAKVACSLSASQRPPISNSIGKVSMPRLQICLVVALVFGLSMAVRADNFVGAHYDEKTDELVVTMRYRGTNADHGFTVRWGQCKPADSGQGHQISAVVLDDQWKDRASTPFTKTTRFSLAAVNCRPAQVTLHTAPRFYYQVAIPAPPSQSHY